MNNERNFFDNEENTKQEDVTRTPEMDFNDRVAKELERLASEKKNTSREKINQVFAVGGMGLLIFAYLTTFKSLVILSYFGVGFNRHAEAWKSGGPLWNIAAASLGSTRWTMACMKIGITILFIAFTVAVIWLVSVVSINLFKVIRGVLDGSRKVATDITDNVKQIGSNPVSDAFKKIFKIKSDKELIDDIDSENLQEMNKERNMFSFDEEPETSKKKKKNKEKSEELSEADKLLNEMLTVENLAELRDRRESEEIEDTLVDENVETEVAQPEEVQPLEETNEVETPVEQEVNVVELFDEENKPKQ